MDVHGDRSILTWNSNSDDLVVAFDGSLSRPVEKRSRELEDDAGNKISIREVFGSAVYSVGIWRKSRGAVLEKKKKKERKKEGKIKPKEEKLPRENE